VPLAVAHFAGAAALWLLWISLYLSTRDIARAEIAVREPNVGARVMS
jgi:hypothetical protein